MMYVGLSAKFTAMTLTVILDDSYSQVVKSLLLVFHMPSIRTIYWWLRDSHIYKYKIIYVYMYIFLCPNSIIVSYSKSLFHMRNVLSFWLC